MQLDPRVQMEKRIKSLEYEMKILKNQLQRTLLDVQEQILVHQYPSLRQDDGSTPQSVRETYVALQASKS